MTDVKWIKLDTEIFSNPKISTVISGKGGKNVFIIWIFLLCLAGKNNENGKISLTEKIPITKNYIANYLKFSPETVENAIEKMKKFEMISIENGFIFIKNWEKYQNADSLEKIRENARNRAAKHRKKVSEEAVLNEE